MQVEVQETMLAEQQTIRPFAGMQCADTLTYDEAVQLQAMHLAAAPQQHAHIVQQQPPGSFHEVQQHVPTLQHGSMLTTGNSVRAADAVTPAVLAAGGTKRRSKEQNIQQPDNQQQSLSYSMEDNSTHCQQRESGSSIIAAVAAFGNAARDVQREQQAQPQLQRLAAPPVTTRCTLFDFDVMVQQMFASNICFSAVPPRHQQQQQQLTSMLAATPPWLETCSSSSNVLANSVCTASPDVPAPTIAKHGAPATTNCRPAEAAVPLAALAEDSEACRSVQGGSVRELYRSLVKPIPVRMADTIQAHASSECWDF
jgi:hypothetical protein